MSESLASSDFSVLRPDWSLPGVDVFTILAQDVREQQVSFDWHTSLGASCRRKLDDALDGCAPVTWLHQVHGCDILPLPAEGAPEVDGTLTEHPGVVCAVLTADCLPVAFVHPQSRKVGMVHAGRRGLEQNILAQMVRRMEVPAEELNVWIGPGIGPDSYRISKEIRCAFLRDYPGFDDVFVPIGTDEYLMNLYEVAQRQLQACGVKASAVSVSGCDTYTDARFHSARRDKEQSGRMATLIWLS